MDFDPIDRFFGQGVHWEYLWSRVRTELTDVPDDVREAVQAAVLYRQSEAEDDRAYGPFGPMWSGGSLGVAVPPPREIGEPTKALWRELANGCRQPAAVARFGDLVWTAGAGPDLAAHARIAITAYRQLANVGWDAADDIPEDGTGHRTWTTYRRAMCLVRALELALALGDDELARGVVSDLLECAASGSIAPVSIALKALVKLPRRLQEPAIHDTAEAALTRFGNTPHNFELFGDLLKALATDAQERRAIEEQQLDRWLEAADAASGLRKLIELQKAAEFADIHNLHHRRDEIRLRLDALRDEDLDLKRIEIPIQIPEAELEAEIGFFIEPASWSEALRRFAFAGGQAPSGEYEGNLATLDDLRAAAPIMSLISQIVVDDGQRPIAHPETDAERSAIDLARHEQIGISLWSGIAAEVLSRLRMKLGIPSEAELTAYFTTDIIPVHIASKVARAFVLFFEGKFDESAHVVVPRIEAIVRAVCLKASIPVSREATARGDNGGVATLGTLLHELEEHGFEVSWSHYLRNVLTERFGVNLRNRIAHGLVQEAVERDAVLLLHVATFLRGVEVREIAVDPPSAPAV